jgi:hypothetical protein
MEIGLKFDGVVANSHLVKAFIAKERFGVDITAEQFRRGLVLTDGLLKREQYKEVERLVMDGSYPIPMVPEARMYLPLLSRYGNSVCIIVNDEREELDFANKWLAGRDLYDLSIFGASLGFPNREIHDGLDVYVDDNLEKLLPLVGLVPELIFFAQQGNGFEKEPECITRVASWPELYKHLWNKMRQELKKHQFA